MKHIFSYTIQPATHFLAKRKNNNQVNALLGELFPHNTEVTCSRNTYEDFIDVMWALGFVIKTLDTIDIDSEGNKLPRKPVKDES